VKLFFRELGQGPPVVILHGLFGSSDNWMTQAKLLAPDYRVYLVDQRNHGQSPWAEEFDYGALAEDLKDFLAERHLAGAIIIGHSMGGKTAMNFAVKYPEQVKALVVVDIVPKTYPVHHDHILEGMDAIPVSTLTSRGEADTVLADYVEEPAVRQFLLKNLSRNPAGGFSWKVNLPVIDRHIDDISLGMVNKGSFSGPCLFIFGRRSDYIKEGDEQSIRTLFPAAEMAWFDTGHWVQAEKPQEFVDLVKGFLKHHG
jgi:pimeloyl-ACP methyl ester carboxylesterase